MNHNYGVLSLGTVTTKHYLKKKLLSLLGIKKKNPRTFYGSQT